MDPVFETLRNRVVPFTTRDTVFKSLRNRDVPLRKVKQRTRKRTERPVVRDNMKTTMPRYWVTKIKNMISYLWMIKTALWKYWIA